MPPIGQGKSTIIGGWSISMATLGELKDVSNLGKQELQETWISTHLTGCPMEAALRFLI